MGHPAQTRALAEQKLRASQPKPEAPKKPVPPPPWRYFTIPSQRRRKIG